MKLSNLSLIVNSSYAAPVIMSVIFRCRFAIQPPLDAGTAQILGPVLFLVAVSEYLVSIWLEKHLLSPKAIQNSVRIRKAKNPEAAVCAAGIVRAALGASPAVYALVISFLGIQPFRWFWLTLAVSAAAFFHQRAGWERYEEALKRLDEDLRENSEK
jgi:hypothetical protein